MGLERKQARLAAIGLTSAAFRGTGREARLLIGRDMAPRAGSPFFAVVRERRERFPQQLRGLTPVYPATSATAGGDTRRTGAAEIRRWVCSLNGCVPG